MSAKTFVSLMLLLILFTAGLYVIGAPARKENSRVECSSGTDCTMDTQAQISDGLILESVSRHLLSVIQ
ncbi:MAG: hypothetical protein ABIU63_12025 [Chitinophagaceae bacterium]